MNKMLKLYTFRKYKKIRPKSINEIINLNKKIKDKIEILNKKR